MDSFSIELGGVTLHGGRHWVTDEWILKPGVSGIGAAGYRASSLELPGRRGVRMLGADLLASRQLAFEAMLVASSPEQAEHMGNVLAGVWRPQSDVTLRARFAAGVRRMVGRTRGCELSFEELHLGVVQARLSFEGASGVWLSERERSASLGVTGRNVGNLVAPLIAPLSSTLEVVEDLGSVIQVRNDGSTAADWSASIDGPVTDLDLVLDGRAVSVVGTVEDGSTMTIDSATRVVEVDGVPVQGWVSVLSDWWQIDPGVHTLEFKAVSGLGTATVSWSDTWL